MNWARALSLLAAVIYCNHSSGAPKSSDAKQKARELFLDSKRKEAIATLYSIQPPLLRDAVHISERFLTDQAQREFETGESQRFMNSTEAEASYQRSIEAEPDNLATRQSLFLLTVGRRRCEDAKKELEQILLTFPDHPRVFYFRSLLARCVGIAPESEPAQKLDPEILPVAYLRLSNIYNLVQRQQIESAGQLADQMLKEKDFPPDVYYWQWKIQQEKGKTETESLKKYIQLCKSSGEAEKRKFKWDPFYCSELQTSEEALRKVEGT